MELTSVLAGPVLGTAQQQQKKTALTINYGNFGALLKVSSLKEHLIRNLVQLFTFIDFPFLRDWFMLR